MFRSCWRVLGLLLWMASLWGCTQAPAPVLTGDEYRVRLVFDGLVTVAHDQQGKPGQAWILVGNASHPEQLEVGKQIPPHLSHLLVRVNDQSGGREAEILEGRTLVDSTTLKQQLELPGDWKETSLQGEDLRLAANTDTQFKLAFDKFRRKQPCNPKKWYLFCWEKRSKRQHDNLGWTADLDEALAKLPGNADDKKIKGCLTDDSYSCTGSPNMLLNARLKLEKSQVFVSQLFGERDGGAPGGELPVFRLEGNGQPLSRDRAQAERVAAELVVSGPVEIRSARLDHRGAEIKPIRIQGEPGKTVEIRLVNHVNHEICHSLYDCQSKGFTDNDFLFNFNLLSNPLFIDVSKLPVPVKAVQDGGPNFDTQCSPTSYRP